MSNWKATTFKASELTDKIKNRDIRVPHYQRGQVWKQGQKDKLIDSIKKGYPFGTILLYEKEDHTFQLIDGLQRSSTIYEYLHSPAKFYRDSDISDEILEIIFNHIASNGEKKAIKNKIKNTICEWVKDNNKTLNDVKNINYIDCAQEIQKQFPTCTDKSIIEISLILRDLFSKFKEECEDLANAEIPAIIYTGNPDNLPEVFNRINSRGTILSKYQILSATWSTKIYTIDDNKLDDIISYVDNFYVSILDKNFTVDGYDINEIRRLRQLNLYQILFGFSKMLIKRYPQLFGKPKKDKEVESCGFNLVNCCLANKNSKLTDMPKILNIVFDKDDKKINQFLINILDVTNTIYKLLKPYLNFKLNKRDSSEIYHTEFQICSMIGNYFNAKYSTLTYDDNQIVIGRNIEIERSNKSFKKFKKEFRKNAFKRYLIDILNDYWRGTGDKRMDDVSINYHYYTSDVTEENIENELDHWFRQVINNRHEAEKVATPKRADKLLLSIIYNRSFTAYEQDDDVTYDIEHLAPKGKLKTMMKKLPKIEGVKYGLPISSFANLCLLREEINRKKRDKTLYQDDKYLFVLKEKNISLEEIEQKFSFTTKEDLNWLDQDYNDFAQLKDAYINFLELRFKKLKTIIINNLFNRSNCEIFKTTYNIQSFKSINLESSIKPIDTIHQIVLLSKENSNEITSSLKGWQKEIFLIIDQFENNVFTLSDLYSYEEELHKKHPTNNSIKSKIRQTLQQLRNLELIKFSNNKGEYIRLWK